MGERQCRHRPSLAIAVNSVSEVLTINPSVRTACRLNSGQVMDGLMVAGATSAAVAGATGSLHCALMCGPLACASLGNGPRASLITWHLGRTLAYTAVGSIIGALGHTLSGFITVSLEPWLTGLMALGLVITALDLARRVPPIPGLGRLSRALARLSMGRGPFVRSFLLGAATPFLPCGLLAGIFLAALATDSSLGGAAVLGAFSLGAIPALVAVQLGARSLDRWPTPALILRRVVPLVAAMVLIVRAVLASQQGPACH
jgi:hypothetical protein